MYNHKTEIITIPAFDKAPVLHAHGFPQGARPTMDSLKIIVCIITNICTI